MSTLKENGTEYSNATLITLMFPYSYTTSLITTMNETFSNISNEQSCEPLTSTPLIITTGIVGCGIVVGNILVIIAIVGGNSNLFRPMFWFIIHLSFSDLSVGAMLLWNYCLAAIFEISNTLNSLTILQGVWVTSACSSVLGILLLAFDRYMQVVHRRMHSMYFNQCTVGIAIFLALLIPIMIFLVAPTFPGWSCKDQCRCFKGKYIECSPISECSQVIPPFTKSYILAVVVYLLFVLPMPVLIYSLIFIKARRSTQAIRQKLRYRDIRLIRTLVVIMVVFIITLFPTGIIITVDYFSTTRNPKLIDYALYVIVLGTLNSLANPILYIWRIPAIRNSLEQKLGCDGRKTSHSEPRTSRTGKKVVENCNSDFPCVSGGYHSPPPGQKNEFLLCSKMFPMEFSDASQQSTPISQRSVNKMSMKPLKKIQRSRFRSSQHKSVQRRQTHHLDSKRCLSPRRGETICNSSDVFIQKESVIVHSNKIEESSIILHGE